MTGGKIIKLPVGVGLLAGVVERFAFKHGKSGVGHMLIPEPGCGETIIIARFPSAGDPGQPSWYKQGALFGVTLAECIRELDKTLLPNKGKTAKQALFFESVEEAEAFEAAYAEGQS